MFNYSMTQAAAAVISIIEAPSSNGACMCLNLCMHIAIIYNWLAILYNKYSKEKIILVFLLSNATLQVVKHTSLFS